MKIAGRFTVHHFRWSSGSPVRSRRLTGSPDSADKKSLMVAILNVLKAAMLLFVLLRWPVDIKRLRVSQIVEIA